MQVSSSSSSFMSPRLTLGSVADSLGRPIPVDDPVEKYRQEKLHQEKQHAEKFQQYQESLQPRPRAAVVVRGSPPEAEDPIEAYKANHPQRKQAAAAAAAAASAATAADVNDIPCEERDALSKWIETWKRDQMVLGKCRANLQQAKLNARESENKLKQLLHSPLLVEIPTAYGSDGDASATQMRPKLIQVAEIERKKALTAQTIRALLRQQLGDPQGEKVFQFLMDSRKTTRDNVLQCKAATRVAKRRLEAVTATATATATALPPSA